MRNLLLLICGFGLTLNLTQACELVASWEPWEPYQFKDGGGKLTGLDNDLIQAVAKEAGCTVRLSNTPWKRALKMIEEGKIHMTAGASYTDERAKFAHYSDPYRNETVAMYVQTQKADKIQTSNVNQLARSGHSVGITRGYFYGDEFAKLKENKQFTGSISEVATDEQNIKKLASGRVDGIFIDRYVGAHMIKNMSLAGKIVEHPTQIISDNIYFIFSKKGTDQATVQKFNDGLKRLKASGEYDRIVNRYLAN